MGRRPLECRIACATEPDHGLAPLIASLGISLWVSAPQWPRCDSNVIKPGVDIHLDGLDLDSLQALRAAARERRLVGRVCIDSFGVLESIDALDGVGRVRGRLLRVPDSDYLGWELALACMPVRGQHRNALPGTGMQGTLVCPRLAGAQLVLETVERCSVATCAALQRWAAASA